MEIQLQENPWQEWSVYLWMISFEHVETKWNNAFWPDLEQISKLVQKTGTMLPLTGERIRWTQDTQNGPIHWSQSKQSHWWVGRNLSGTKHEGRSPSHCSSAHNVHKPVWDTNFGYRVGHNSNAATKFPDALRWQPLQQLAMLSLSLSLNKLARQMKSHPVKLQNWPPTGPLRILEFPDAS